MSSRVVRAKKLINVITRAPHFYKFTPFSFSFYLKLKRVVNMYCQAIYVLKIKKSLSIFIQKKKKQYAGVQILRYRNVVLFEVFDF